MALTTQGHVGFNTPMPLVAMNFDELSQIVSLIHVCCKCGWDTSCSCNWDERDACCISKNRRMTTTPVQSQVEITSI
jgi:hypothetical protein